MTEVCQKIRFSCRFKQDGSGCFPQSTDTCGYWRRDCLSRTRVAGQFRLPVAIRLVSSEIFLGSRS